MTIKPLHLRTASQDGRQAPHTVSLLNAQHFIDREMSSPISMSSSGCKQNMCGWLAELVHPWSEMTKALGGSPVKLSSCGSVEPLTAAPWNETPHQGGSDSERVWWPPPHPPASALLVQCSPHCVGGSSPSQTRCFFSFPQLPPSTMIILLPRNPSLYFKGCVLCTPASLGVFSANSSLYESP